MAKNMTRKGLAAGAGFALVGSLFAAVPAQALDPVELNPADGDSYNVPASAGNFELDAFFSTAAQFASSDHVGFVIVDADGGLDLSSSSVSYAGPTSTTDLESTGAAIESTDTDSDTGTVTVVTNNNTPGAGAATTLLLDVDGTPADSFSVTVQAFIDNNANGEYNEGTDSVSATRTVNFLVDDDITWTTNFTAPVLGDEKLVATVETSPDLNLDQAGTVKVAFGTYDSAGDAYAPLGSAVETVDGVFTDGETANADGQFEHTFGGDGVTAQTYVAVALLDSVEISDEVLRTVVAGEAATISAPELSSSPDANETADEVRLEGSSVEIFTVVEDGDGDPVEGASVDFTISDVDLADDGTVTVNGETLTGDGDGTTETIEVTVATDDEGKAAITVAYADQEANNTFGVEVKVEALTALTTNFNFVATAVDSINSHNVLGDFGNAELKVTEGSTYNLLFAVLDNFGEPFDDSDFRVILNDGGSVTQTSNINSGVASFSVTDQDDVNEVWTANVQEYNSGTATYTNTGDSAAITPIVGSSNAAADVTSIADEDVDLSIVELEDANERLGESGPTALLTSSEFTGAVTDASGLRTYSMVTFSSPNVLFQVETEESGTFVYSMGTATVMTDGNGNYAGVRALSNHAGEQTVVVSAGSGSEDVVLTFDPAASDAGTSLVIDAPSSVEPGSTLQFTATLTDDFGNAVNGGSAEEVVFNYDGPGFVVGTLPTAFGADGTATVTIFLGNNDDGKTGTLTVSYSPTGDDTYATEGDLVVQKTVNIGDSLGSGAFNAWTKLVENDTAVKFYAKNPSAEGKIQFLFNGEEIAWHRGTTPTSYEGGALRYNEEMDAYYLVRDVELVSGMKNTFEIYQDGTRIWRAVKTVD